MKYPNILARLIVGKLIILSAFIFFSVVFLTNLKKINTINQQIIDHPFKVTNAAKDIYTGIRDMQRLMKDVAFVTDDSILNEALLKVNKDEQEVLQNFIIVKEQYLGDEQDVKSALKEFIDWRPIRQEVVNLSRQDKTIEAYSITTGKGAAHVDTLLSKIAVITNFAMNKANEFNRNSISISKKANFNSIFYLVIISIIILGTLIWILIGISSPLNKIIARINKLSEKENRKGSFQIKKNILETLHASVDDLEILKTKLEELVKQRTQELQDEKEFTELALNNQSDSFLVFDPETGKAIRWNKSFSNISGYSDDEIKEMKVPGIYFSEESLENTREIFREVNEKGIGSAKLVLITKNNEYIPFEYSFSRLADKNTGGVYFVAVGRDITERLINEAELEKHRNHLQYLVNEQTEEIQVNNEELKAANEEQAAVNEELLSLNEELKTANEEQAALNEEIAATNEELEARTDELAASNQKLLETNKELKRFNELFVNREFRIKELKDKVKELENKLGKL